MTAIATTALATIDVTYSEIERDQMRDQSAARASARFVITTDENGTTSDGTEWTARLVHDTWTDQWVVALDDPDYEEAYETYESLFDATDALDAHLDRFVDMAGFGAASDLSFDFDVEDFGDFEDFDFDE